MRAININWVGKDVDKVVDLPTEIDVPQDLKDFDEISDWLTSEFGFLNYGFELEEEKINRVRKRALDWSNVDNYKDFGKFRDLIAFDIGESYFCLNPDTDEEEESDFSQVIVIVEKDWLFQLIKEENGLEKDEDARKVLKEEYTWDDSMRWFAAASKENKIFSVDFC